MKQITVIVKFWYHPKFQSQNSQIGFTLLQHALARCTNNNNIKEFYFDSLSGFLPWTVSNDLRKFWDETGKHGQGPEHVKYSK